MAQQYTLEEVQKKSNEEVLAELQRQGIGSLEDLVSQSMDSLRSAGPGEAPGGFEPFMYVFWWFIFTSEQ